MERLKELALFSLQKEKTEGVLITVFIYLEGDCRETGDGLFLMMLGDKPRSNGFKFQQGKFSVERRKNVLSLRVGTAFEQDIWRNC